MRRHRKKEEEEGNREDYGDGSDAGAGWGGEEEG